MGQVTQINHAKVKKPTCQCFNGSIDPLITTDTIRASVINLDIGVCKFE